MGKRAMRGGRLSCNTVPRTRMNHRGTSPGYIGGGPARFDVDRTESANVEDRKGRSYRVRHDGAGVVRDQLRLLCQAHRWTGTRSGNADAASRCDRGCRLATAMRHGGWEYHRPRLDP